MEIKSKYAGTVVFSANLSFSNCVFCSVAFHRYSAFRTCMLNKIKSAAWGRTVLDWMCDNELYISAFVVFHFCDIELLLMLLLLLVLVEFYGWGRAHESETKVPSGKLMQRAALAEDAKPRKLTHEGIGFLSLLQHLTST